MSYEEIKSHIHYKRDFIDVDRELVTKEQLSIWDLRELIRLIEYIDSYRETQTINKRVAKLLMKSGVIMFETEIGWEV